MPSMPPSICCAPGCGRATQGRYCPDHLHLLKDRRPSARRRGYDAAWSRARAEFLKAHPFCQEMVDGHPCGRPATDVDHAVPHRGDSGLFWDRANWRALCHSHHSAKTARVDGGFGNPIRRPS